MAEFTTVAKLNEISDPGTLLVELDERLIVVFRMGEEFYALDDVCTHDGGPLSEGERGDHWIACPRHGAKFDIRTGAALSMPATQPTVAHEVRLQGDDIQIKITAD